MNWGNLRKIIDENFNLEELRTLCFDLEIDYESLPGEGKEAKVRELIAFVKRANRTDELLIYCRKCRPKASWPQSTNSSFSNEIGGTRQSFLKKVRSNWISDVLENSLHLQALAGLDSNQSETAELPLLMSLDLPNRAVAPPIITT